MNNRQHYFPGVIVGGLVAGILSAIPFVNYVNCCFCLWVVAGGLLSAFLVHRKAGVALSYGEGAIIGAIAGVITGLLAGAVNGLFQYLGLFSQPMAADNPVSEMGPLARAAVAFCGAVIIFPIFAALGGLLGSLISQKKSGGDGGQPPQGGAPPQQGGGFPPPQQGGAPPQQGGGGFPPQQGGAPPQQGGAPPQQGGGFPPQQGGGGAPPGGGYPPPQGGGYPGGSQ